MQTRLLSLNKLFPSLASEQVGHECGVGLIKLRKPLSYYYKKYGDITWPIHKLFLLMRKQSNRGQDGAGIATAQFDQARGYSIIKRLRSAKHNSTNHIFSTLNKQLKPLQQLEEQELLSEKIKQQYPFLADTYLGHLRYGTHAGNGIAYCQPYLYKHAKPAHHFAIAGNFNMTNSSELLATLKAHGINPSRTSDTQLVLEWLAYCIEQELGTADGENRSLAHLHWGSVLKNAAAHWDGGYVFCGVHANGDLFVCRDPAGIRPGFILIDDDIIAAASERVALIDAFQVSSQKVKPIPPGQMIIVKQNGTITQTTFATPLPIKQCSFERIYFSRVNDPDIYKERKALGKNLAVRILKTLNYDIEHTVFSYIPNSGEAPFIGLMQEIDRLTKQKHALELWQKLQTGVISKEELIKVFSKGARTERITYKDQSLRTFISDDKTRPHLVSHIYDITKETVNPDDTLVVMDDSIVRGTTLKEVIIKQLSTLNPKKIIIVSSAPPIMYPDCYGIDMSQLSKFIAYQAAIELLTEQRKTALLEKIAQKSTEQNRLSPKDIVNHVQEIYRCFTLEDLEHKIAELVRPHTISWHGEIQMIYQTVEGLHKAIPHYTGDWYFTGDYPTPGGFKVLNTSYLNWYKKSDARAY